LIAPYKIKIIGDKSLSRRDFNRIAEPLKKFGARYQANKKRIALNNKG
jgi:3-phosphoshikimate 1-carboxyvinyltransferase